MEQKRAHWAGKYPHGMHGWTIEDHLARQQQRGEGDKWARKRAVRMMFRNAPYFLRGRQNDRWRFKWALQVCRKNLQCKFYIFLTYDIFNPRHNGGDGAWHRITDARYGPLGPDKPSNIPNWANEGLVRVGGRYPHDVIINVVDWRHDITNDPGVLAFALAPQEVPLQSARPLQYQYLTYFDAIHPSSLEADSELAVQATGECVAVALLQWLLHPPCNRPKGKIPHSEYDHALLHLRDPNSCRGGRNPEVKVTRESIVALLEAIRDKMDSSWCDEGFSLEMVMAFCRVFKLNMVALDKENRIVAKIDEFKGADGHHTPLACYAFHGHMYLLAKDKATAKALVTKRAQRDSVRMHTTHNSLVVQTDAILPRDGAFVVYDASDPSSETFELTQALAGGVHMLRDVTDLRQQVLRLMSEHAIDPRIDKSTQGGITSFSFKSSAGENVRVVADPHPCQQVDHKVLRDVVHKLGLSYSPDAAMGKVVVQILARIARERKRFTTDEYDGVVQSQNFRCACGCDAQLHKADSKWNAEFDHITPLADGGLDEVDNLQALTPYCHGDKSQTEVERGYFMRSAYASQLNGHVLARMHDEHSMFHTVQFVDARWIDSGTVVKLHDHPFWEDGTRARVETREEGGWTIDPMFIRLLLPLLLRPTLHVAFQLSLKNGERPISCNAATTPPLPARNQTATSTSVASRRCTR